MKHEALSVVTLGLFVCLLVKCAAISVKSRCDASAPLLNYRNESEPELRALSNGNDFLILPSRLCVWDVGPRRSQPALILFTFDITRRAQLFERELRCPEIPF